MAILIAVITQAAIWAWVMAHQLVVYYFFSVIVDQMPKPAGGSPLYTWLFGVLHFAAANWNRAKMGFAVKSDSPPPP